MKVEIVDSCVCGIPLEEFPERYVCYHNSVREGSTIPLERDGAKFLIKCLEGDALSFVFQGEVKDFIKKVLWWGLGEEQYDTILDYIYPRQPDNQTEEAVTRKVRQAALSLRKGNLQLAIKTLDNSQKQGVKGMKLSIGSKVLRMISPEKACAFDELHLQEKLSYPADSDGYADFCGNCVTVAEQMNKKGIEHEFSIEKMRGSPKWLAADVEAVVFDCLRGTNPL